MARPTFVYVSYIRTTPGKLWAALLETGSAVLRDPYPVQSARSGRE